MQQGRRTFVLGIAASAICGAETAFAQQAELVVLPGGITSSSSRAARWTRGRAISLEGWLLCNGAAVPVAEYRELYAVVGRRNGQTDDRSTFRLPSYAFEMSRGDPIAGQAICPKFRYGVVGTVLPFNVSGSNT